MKKMKKNMIPAIIAISMALGIPAYGEEFVPGPGRPYDDATMEKLQDNVLEYDEIGKLVETYNTTLKNLKQSYSDKKDSYKDINKLQDQILQSSASLADTANTLAGTAAMFEGSLGYQAFVTPGTYGEMVYSSEILSSKAEQVALSADSLSAVTPDMLRIKMVDSTRASLIFGAQSAVIGLEQLGLQKESLEDSIRLLEAVLKSTEGREALGLATANEVKNARQNLDSVKANRITLEANETKIRQGICTLLGWEYNADPTINRVPSSELSRIDGMDPEKDKEAAVAANYTLRYNQLDYEQKTEGSVEKENLGRTIESQTASIGASLVNLYNSVLQKRNEYETAQAAFSLEQEKMEAAERKLQVGTIGQLEYLQQKNAYTTKKIAVKTADLALFQAMETYDWAVKGNLSIS